MASGTNPFAALIAQQLNNPPTHSNFSTNSQHIYHHHYGLPYVYWWKEEPLFTEQPTPAMKAAVSRAFKRLVDRGLMEQTNPHPNQHDFALTDGGIQQAEAL